MEKAGKCLFTVDRICKQFEQQTASRKSLGSHAIPVFGKDFDTILKVLEEEEIFTTLKKCDHGTFKFTNECTMITLLECCEYFFLLENFKNGVKILSKYWNGMGTHYNLKIPQREACRHVEVFSVYFFIKKLACLPPLAYNIATQSLPSRPALPASCTYSSMVVGSPQ